MLDTLFQNVTSVLRAAIERGADPGALPDSFLLPHRRRDGRCPACGGELGKTKVSGRTTYFCPDCQKGP